MKSYTTVKTSAMIGVAALIIPLLPAQEEEQQGGSYQAGLTGSSEI